MFRLASFLMMVAVLTACQSSPDFNKPPEIHYGEDICEQCNMIISEPRYAAGYIAADGNMRRFDDIGDMMVYHDTHSEEVAVFWVHDYDSEEWIHADDALFIVSESLTTPMAHGVIAFLDHERARAMAEELNGNPIKFEELMDIEIEDGLPLHSHAEHMNGTVDSDVGHMVSQEESTIHMNHSQHSN